MRIDPFALPAVVLVVLGFRLILRGLELALPLGEQGNRHGVTLVFEGLAWLGAAALILLFRRRPVLATLVVSPGAAAWFLMVAFPVAGYAWIAFAVLTPVSAIAALSGCVRIEPAAPDRQGDAGR